MVDYNDILNSNLFEDDDLVKKPYLCLVFDEQMKEC